MTFDIRDDIIMDVTAVKPRFTQPRSRRSLAPIGLDIIRLLARNPHGSGISDLARAVGLEIAQAHRVVRELATAGWVAQDQPNGSYRLTGALLALAAEQLHRIELREIALPTLRRLKAETGESVHLAEFRGARLNCVARELSDAPVVATTQIGDSWTLGSHAAVSVATEAAIISSGQAELLPPDYEVTEERRRALAITTARGWSYDEAKYRPGVCAIGAAVLDLEARPVGAIAISWPEGRVLPGSLPEIGERARAGAAEISAELGHLRGRLSAPWRTTAEMREEDLFRHLSDLRSMTYEGADGRSDQERVFSMAATLLAPVVEEVLMNASERLLIGTGSVARTESSKDGISVWWTLTWPEQLAAINRATGERLDPVAVVARLRPSHIHGHLGGSYFGDWPLQILTPEDAQRQTPVVLSIVEAEIHQRVFEAGGNWRLIPAYGRQVEG